MKPIYFNVIIFGMIVLTSSSRSQNILFDGDFSQTNEIILFEINPPPMDSWGYWRNYYGNGSDADPIVVDGICVFQIINPGNNTWDVQLAQWGFHLIQGHQYRLSFDVKAFAPRSLGVFLGEDGGDYTNLLAANYTNYATTQWETITIDFEATSVFALHKLSFELGTNDTTTYFDNINLQDLNEPAEKVVLAGTFQFKLGCNGNWVANCSNTQLYYNPDSGLYEGYMNIPPGCYDYKVVLDDNWQNNYGKEGILNGENYRLYIPKDPEATHFTYDPVSHVVNSTPYGTPTEELTSVLLLGTLQDDLGCANDYKPDCPNSELKFNSESGLWEGNFMLPAGCYSYLVRASSPCKLFHYGEDGISGGDEIELYVPIDSEVTFKFDPDTHLITSTPYSGVPQDIKNVSLYGSLQNDLGCEYDSNYSCDKVALELDAHSGLWSGSFPLTAGCYFYKVMERRACLFSVFGENGIAEGDYIELYIPSDGEITFTYDPQTHLITSSPYTGVPQGGKSISLIGSFQSEIGCPNDNDIGCDNPALVQNSETGIWEGSFTFPPGCYTYRVKEMSGCDFIFYGKDGVAGSENIELYIPSNDEVSFKYNPVSHKITSSPFGDPPQEVRKVSLWGSLQNELGCPFDNNDNCEEPALIHNEDTGMWEGTYTLPAGCYSYRIQETFGCEVNHYGENGNKYWPLIELYVPSEAEITFRYDPQTHTIVSTPYSGSPQEVTKVSLLGTLQDELGCASDYDYECNNSALIFNENSGAWEGSFSFTPGCYTYLVKETVGCNRYSLYGKDGMEGGNNKLVLFVPSENKISFSYDPQTNIITSLPYTDISTVNQCPEDIFTINGVGTCGAIINYPEFIATSGCGGEIVSVTQTEGLASGSLFPIGTTTNTYVLTNTTGEIQTCRFDVVVTDSEAPVIADLKDNYEPLWPPNHKMVPVFIDYIALDNCTVATAELNVTSNEPQTGTGNGDKAPDWEVVDEHKVLLRAERSGKGDGREYYITIKVTDESGNFTERTVTVAVANSMGKATEGTYTAEFGNDGFLLYPTPAKDVVKIKGPESVSNRSYSIYDMLGVMKIKGIIQDDQVEVGTLPGGTYILKFGTKHGITSKQFIRK